MNKKAEDLEKKFDETYQKVHEQIQPHLNEAKAALDKACRLSDEAGIPFRFESSSIRIDDTYFPSSFFTIFDSEDWKDIDEFHSSIHKKYDFDMSGCGGFIAGWQASRSDW